MNLMEISLTIACLSVVFSGLVLTRYLLLKRALYALKQDMKQHHLQHGFDNQLWATFVERTRDMLGR